MVETIFAVIEEQPINAARLGDAVNVTEKICIHLAPFSHYYRFQIE